MNPIYGFKYTILQTRGKSKGHNYCTTTISYCLFKSRTKENEKKSVFLYLYKTKTGITDRSTSCGGLLKSQWWLLMVLCVDGRKWLPVSSFT